MRRGNTPPPSPDEISVLAQESQFFSEKSPLLAPFLTLSGQFQQETKPT
jgi:hypothetical protein